MRINLLYKKLKKICLQIKSHNENEKLKKEIKLKELENSRRHKKGTLDYKFAELQIKYPHMPEFIGLLSICVSIMSIVLLFIEKL